MIDSIDPSVGIPLAVALVVAWITLEVWCAKADR